VELTPRTAPDPSDLTTAPRGRSLWAYGILAVVLVAVGVVAYQGLTSASLYFYNADEAVAERDTLGDKRIRVQGTVQEGVETTAEGVTFTIAFNGVEVPVIHDGDPPELFEPGIPVVLEGHWATDAEPFLSDEILVKHDEQYEADNGDRIADAEDGQSGDTPAP
jgi:cytochrome c-type biogenesis protein CcmE